MKIYIEKDPSVDVYGDLTKVIRSLRGINGVKSKIYLVEEKDFTLKTSLVDCDLDVLIRQHFSIEEDLRKKEKPL